MPPLEIDNDLFGVPKPHAVDALGPLSYMPRPNRGAVKTITPSEEPIPILDGRESYGPNRPVGYPLLVTLGMSPIEPIETEEMVHVSVRAIVEWYNGASAAYQATVDWLAGTAITLSGEKVTVRAHYLVEVPSWLDVERFCAPKVEVSAGVGYGTTGGNVSRATFTEFVAIETRDMIQEIPIPAFARSFSVALAGTSTSARVRAIGANPALAVPYVIQGPATNVGQFDGSSAFPLPNGTRMLEVTNTNANGDPLFAFVVFGLAIG